MLLWIIIKIKAEPATNRIKRLLEVLSSYSFNLYYIKSKDMILSDFFLERNITKVILMKSYQYLLICKKYCILDITIYINKQKRYFIQTRSQAKTSHTVLPKVQSIDKGVVPNLQLEKQMMRPVTVSC